MQWGAGIVNLANRIAAKIPIDGVTVEVRKVKPKITGVIKIDGMDEFKASEDWGYNIFFKFPNIKLEAIHHTNTLNLSNNAIDRMVKDVAVSFRDMIMEVNNE